MDNADCNVTYLSILCYLFIHIMLLNNSESKKFLSQPLRAVWCCFTPMVSAWVGVGGGGVGGGGQVSIQWENLVWTVCHIP